MNDWTADQLKEDLIKYQDDDGNDIDYMCNYGYHAGYSFDLPGYGTVITVEIQPWREQVNEFAGSYTDWVVYFVVKVQDRFFKFSGVDSSWDSPGIENIDEVEPVAKTVTVWEKRLDY